jgi:hypothetical protein
MICKSKIAIVTTVSKKVLYSKTATLFPKGIDKIMIDGENGMYGIDSIDFMFKKLKKKNYEWVIMVDEDVFFHDGDLVFEVINQMKENNIAICGVRDGGVIKHRAFNPESINTFFSIINFKKILEKYDFKKIKTYQRYIPELYAEKSFKQLKYDFEIESVKEYYYCFYFWPHMNNFKFLYLDALNPVGDDEVGNLILSPSGKTIAFHSWYARAYNVYEDQTIRINSFLDNFNILNSNINMSEVKIIKSFFFNWRKRCKKNIRRVLKV